MAYDYGLFTNPITVGQTPRAKKAFDAYTTALEWLGEATFGRRLAPSEVSGPEMDAYKFTDAAGKTFYVAWLNPVELGVDVNGDGKPDKPAEFESLRLPYNGAEVYNIYGERTAVLQDSDGDIRVSVGAQPAYIKITN